jgi:hypothetical protein
MKLADIHDTHNEDVACVRHSFIVFKDKETCTWTIRAQFVLPLFKEDHTMDDNERAQTYATQEIYRENTLPKTDVRSEEHTSLSIEE